MSNIEKSWPMTVSVYMYYILFFILLFSVFRNGDLLCPPFRFIIPRSMRQDLEQILSLVTEKVSLRTGAVRRWVTLTDTVTNTYKQREKSSRWNKNHRAPSGCALWKEWLCPQPLSWRPAAAMLLWEPRDSRNFHMWSCWSQKLQRGIVMRGPLWVCVCKDVCFFCICAGCSALQSVRHERIWTILFRALLSLSFLIFLIL